MIIVKILGGLGNQLFQYAASKALAIRNNSELAVDASWYDTVDPNYRDVKLFNFNVTSKLAEKKELSRYRIGKIIAKILPQVQGNIFTEKNPGFQPELLELKGDWYLDGYFQSEKYFKAIEETIRREITLKYSLEDKYPEISTKIKNTNSVSVHIRRGDYLMAKHQTMHPICTPEYYADAVGRIKNSIADPVLFFFSDDIEWVKENLKFDLPAEYVSSPDMKDYEEMLLMSRCKHQITANSSFSWWGAWLNSNPAKIVIAPKVWFGDPSKSTGDLVPEEWIRI
jgi:hypothetical protein